MNILVTGGAGYIGSHTCLELLNAGYDVAVIDNLSNSREESMIRVQELAGRNIVFHKVDLLDKIGLDKVFGSSQIDAVIHFAGLKAVSESVEFPLLYYQNNVSGTLNLCEAMKKYNVKNIVFSSSATVYGDPHAVPVTEEFPLNPTNPYGHTKLMIENILRDIYNADNEWNISLLRYFNPAGAHQSGRIGEDPGGVPSNLFPYIARVAVGKLNVLSVFGNDYHTNDGTGVRDYIHVVDVALGHVKALKKLERVSGVIVLNLGTGRGYSVLEIISAFEKASGRKIPYKIVGRRSGDVASSYADPSKAERELGWSAYRGLDEMCEDVWRWQSANPNGYE